MRVLVLGGGVIGVTASWYLAEDGHEVTLVDRQAGPALETSFANGGQVSASFAEPWANPGAPATILKWLGREDAPLLFRLRADVRQWRWGLQFLRECLPSRTRRNTIECLKLAVDSLECLKALRQATGIEYDQQTRGILHFYTDAREFARAVRDAEAMRAYGSERDILTVEQSIALEPALTACRERLVGGIFTAKDESGDAQRFTSELARRATARGVTFKFGVDVKGIECAGDAVQAVRAVEAGTEMRLKSDAYVVALGSYSPLLLEPIGVPCRVYPVKGYSATIDIGGYRGAPTVSLTDVERKIVITRLGTRLRVAGTAELTGWDTALNAGRCEALTARAFELFPDAGDRRNIRYWAGLRPATPSNVPIIGPTRYGNLWLDTGHGTLGWTLACASGRRLADMMSGRAACATAL